MFSDSVPDPVCRVLRRVDRLECAVLAPFPDLDETPDSIDTARGKLREAARWGRRIHWICTGHYDGKRQMRTRGNSLDGLLSVGVTGGSILFARDVLGPPPEFLATGCSTAALTDLDEGERLDPVLAGLDPIAEWQDITHSIRMARRTAFMQAFVVIDWARERARAIGNAVVPVLTVDALAQTVEIVLAGRTRIVPVSPAHVAVFEQWADGPTASVVSRGDMKGRKPRALVHRVPELDPYVTIDRAATAKAGDPANAGVYRLDEVARARLNVQSNR